MTFFQLWRTHHERAHKLYITTIIKDSDWDIPHTIHVMLHTGKAPLCTEDMEAIKESMIGPTIGIRPVVRIRHVQHSRVNCPACIAIAESAMFELVLV